MIRDAVWHGHADAAKSESLTRYAGSPDFPINCIVQWGDNPPFAAHMTGERGCSPPDVFAVLDEEAVSHRYYRWRLFAKGDDPKGRSFHVLALAAVHGLIESESLTEEKNDVL